ncbi:hypothetical protein [Alcanivorax sp.]|uniref:hypothetical protein n=1 Tax=Alcanivorax sp. TaxID=1872427 RepID=UPI002622D509|nr:hypothetical protein [Alcanivorax sp.]
MANQILYIASGSAPLSSQFQETLDMLLTGAAFGQPTTLWLTTACLDQLQLMPSDILAQLPDFGVRCVTNAPAPAAQIPLETLDDQKLLALRDDCRQVLVF